MQAPLATKNVQLLSEPLFRLQRECHRIRGECNLDSEGVIETLSELSALHGEPKWSDPVGGTRFYESPAATAACVRHSSAYSAGVLYPSALCGLLRL